MVVINRIFKLEFEPTKPIVGLLASGAIFTTFPFGTFDADAGTRRMTCRVGTATPIAFARVPSLSQLYSWEELYPLSYGTATGRANLEPHTLAMCGVTMPTLRCKNTRYCGESASRKHMSEDSFYHSEQ